MPIKQAKLVYFSPTGNVRRTLRKIAEGIGLEPQEYDLTSFSARWQKYIFTAEDFVLVGMPVYGGRIPAISVEFFRGIRANNTPAVFVVSYGNRDYEDGLLELKQTCEEKGFIGIAAAAFIGEHSCSADIAAGRPDALDDEKALLFGRQIADKLKTVTATSLMPKFQVKGNYPYIRRREMLVTPATNSSCNHCGICSAECPVSAINPDEPAEVDSYRCLCCFRCIRNCPQKARYIHNDRFNNFIAQLKQTCTARKEPELFL